MIESIAAPVVQLASCRQKERAQLDISVAKQVGVIAGEVELEDA